MTILVTGAAGFIGSHVALALRARGERVVGVDNLNAYYDPALKRARLERLASVGDGAPRGDWRFVALDITDASGLAELIADEPSISAIVHLAAQAGVRYSLVDPYAYVRANIMGHVTVLEAARRAPGLRHLVYASSSSVYGANDRLPFSEADAVDRPTSLYAATKRSDELISEAYAHLHELPQTGLRFFTVYGPWGRPDMAYFEFAEAISAGRPITLYDNGAPRRDFTYIDDVVSAVLGVLDIPPGRRDAHHRVLNVGNRHSVPVRRLVELLQDGLGRQVVIRDVSRPAADLPATWADISAIQTLTGWAPVTDLETGIGRFIDWFTPWSRQRQAALLAVD